MAASLEAAAASFSLIILHVGVKISLYLSFSTLVEAAILKKRIKVWVFDAVSKIRFYLITCRE